MARRFAYYGDRKRAKCTSPAIILLVLHGVDPGGGVENINLHKASSYSFSISIQEAEGLPKDQTGNQSNPIFQRWKVYCNT